jgi:hypothetical protein
MKCICANCKYRIEQPEGIVCERNLAFTNPEATCLDWDNNELFKPTKLVALAIVVIGIVLILSNFL